MRFRNLAARSAAGLVLVVGAGSAQAAPAAARATTVKVTAKDYSFALSTKVVPPGRVTFLLHNDGRTSHDFTIAGHSSKTIAPGTTTRLTVRLEAGRYPYKCTVDSHAELGMKGVLRVEA